MKLHFGIVDIPYSKAAEAPKPVAKAKKGGKKAPPVKQAKPGEGGTQTTYQVAQWLEEKYGIMEKFGELQLPAIAHVLEKSLADHMDSLMQGVPDGGDPFAEACSEIDLMFQQFILDNEMAFTGTPGVPTAASLRGVNHRLKLKKGAPRPSFKDTGLYISSFKSSME